MDIVIITSAHRLMFGDLVCRCALGKGGARADADKREGDGATPLGRYPLRSVRYRADRIDPPETGLPCVPLAPDDAWCDAPEHEAYNRPVKRPFPASHEELWREDHVYDIIVELGHNDDPVMPYRGSAVFMHLAREGFEPTEGCVALTRADMLKVLALAGPQTVIDIRA